MYLSNGNPTEAVDVMHYCWKGYWPEKRAPSIQEIFLNGESWKANHEFNDRDVIELSYVIDKYNNEKVYLNFEIYPETFSTQQGGDFQKSPEKIDFKIINESNNKLVLEAPRKNGAYRIFVFAKNDYNQYSVANIPFKVR